MKHYALRRLFMLFAGILLMSIGTAFLATAGFGTDPFSCLVYGISHLTHLPFWVIHLIVGAFGLTATYFLLPHLVRLGMVAHLILAGIFTNLFGCWLQDGFGNVHTLSLRIVFLVSGLLLFALASSMYFMSNLGITVYDAVGFAVSKKLSPLPHRWCRILLDLLLTALGLACGASVGIASAVTIFCLGPLVKLFHHTVSIPLLGQDPD